ncbi:hypothetical protein C8N46_101821 [Kordia periserrulae]|uniref:Uncharacterized protein n=1 Tax=Kordia periserrulae TaxID=701523 RepID=A0A2T6C7B9_9FLAO|nr:hypothetical protein [Kordia periserrulae]PTX64210.1 hypothetical protein C8N46_101821 [Kordia periserrulae]
MKKRNLKSLKLNKKSIIRFENMLTGGLAPTTTSVTTYSIEYSNCDWCPIDDAPSGDISAWFPGNC